MTYFILGVSVLIALIIVIRRITKWRSARIIREVCGLLAKDLLERLSAARIRPDQIVKLGVQSDGLLIEQVVADDRYIYEPKDAQRILGAYKLTYKRENGCEVHVRDLEMVAKRLIADLGLTDYTYQWEHKTYTSSDNTYITTTRTVNGKVETVTTPRTIDTSKLYIVRKPPVVPKKKVYYV